MIAKILITITQKILRISQKENIPIMFMGGIAVSLWAIPRATYDVDAVIQISQNSLKEFLAKASRQGFAYDRKKPIKIIQGLSFITLSHSIKKHKVYVDLFLAQSQYFKKALSRRKKVVLSGMKIPIISAEDLILYKLLSGRGKDLDDIREILLSQRGKLDLIYLKKWAKELGIITQLEDELSSVYGINSKNG